MDILTYKSFSCESNVQGSSLQSVISSNKVKLSFWMSKIGHSNPPLTHTSNVQSKHNIHHSIYSFQQYTKQIILPLFCRRESWITETKEFSKIIEQLCSSIRIRIQTRPIQNYELLIIMLHLWGEDPTPVANHLSLASSESRLQQWTSQGWICRYMICAVAQGPVLALVLCPYHFEILENF